MPEPVDLQHFHIDLNQTLLILHFLSFGLFLGISLVLFVFCLELLDRVCINEVIIIGCCPIGIVRRLHTRQNVSVHLSYECQTILLFGLRFVGWVLLEEAFPEVGALDGDLLLACWQVGVHDASGLHLIRGSRP